ncbi:MAG: hypothetical protein WCP39_00650 [Chlamydiota bacterium]
MSVFVKPALRICVSLGSFYCVKKLVNTIQRVRCVMEIRMELGFKICTMEYLHNTYITKNSFEKKFLEMFHRNVRKNREILDSYWCLSKKNKHKIEREFNMPHK